MWEAILLKTIKLSLNLLADLFLSSEKEHLSENKFTAC